MSVASDITERFDVDNFTRSLIETAPTLIYVFDLVEYRNIYMSRQIETLLGYSAGEIGAMGAELIRRLGHPDEQDLIARHHSAIRESTGDGPFQITYRLRHRDGSWRWLVSREVPYQRDTQGSIAQIIGSALDITDLKQAESDARRSERRLEAALRSGDLGVHEYDVRGNEILWNRKTRDLWGIDDDVPITYEIFEGGVHPDDRDGVRKAIARAMTPAGEGKYAAEFRVVSRRDGRVRCVLADADVTFEGDQAIRFVGLVRDVTELHLYRDALDAQKRLYQSVTDNATTALFIMDERQHCVFMNPAAVAMTGYSLEETQGRALHDVIHHTRPDGTPYPICECPIDQAFPKNDRMRGEDVFVHKNGHFYPVAYTASPLRDAEGTSIGTVIEVRDITERKKNEAARLDSEHRYRTLFERAAVGLAEVATDGTWINVNQALCDMLGYTRDELVQKTWQELTHPDDLQEDLDLVGAVLRGEFDTYRYAKRYLAKTGEIVDAIITVTCIRREDGSVDYFLPIVENVSARRRAERALQASEARYRSVVQDQTEMLCRYRADGTLLLVNNAYAEAHGSTPSDLEGRCLYDILPVRYAASIRAVISSLNPERPAVSTVYRVKKRDGSLAWEEWVNRLVPGGEEMIFQATGRDVTEQLTAEGKLLQSRERLRLAARTASLTYIILDIVEQKITRLDNFASVMGFDIGDGTPLATADEIFLAHVHPDDRDNLKGHVEAVHRGIAPGQIEFRIIDDAGGSRWIECRSHVERGPEGKPRRIFIINSDVTARKSTELQLEFATRELVHRSKNLLSVIQGIAHTSARLSGGPEFVSRFSRRIEALARSQDLLVHGTEKASDIAALVSDQLSIAVGEDSRTIFEGPNLVLRAKAAQALGLALHELATNSVKYGALSNDRGKVHITWRAEGGTFSFSWRESGGPPLTAPDRTGFGRTIIERIAPSQLGGTARLTFDPEGLRWNLAAPVHSVLDGPVAAL